MRFTGHKAVKLTTPGCKAVMMLCLALLASASVSGNGQEAGRVLFAPQGLRVVSGPRAPRTLRPGEAFESGDVLQSRSGHAQLTLDDGALVSLAPFSRLSVDDFRRSAADGRGIAYFSLLRGAMRFSAGPDTASFGDRYRLRTWAADLIVRDAVFSVRLCRGDCASVGLAKLGNGLHLVVERGEVMAFNVAGAFSVGEGWLARIADYRSAARVEAGDVLFLDLRGGLN